MVELPPKGSYVKITAIGRKTIGVVTYSQKSPGLFVMAGRWFGSEYDEALHEARHWIAAGYVLRDELSSPLSRKSLEVRQ
jgi:hypothetical protein